MHTIIFILCLVVFVVGGDGTRSRNDNFRYYISGLEHLDKSSKLTESEKSSYYRKLVELTGFTAESATKYIKKYENNPKKWMKFLTSIIDELHIEKIEKTEKEK